MKTRQRSLGAALITAVLLIAVLATIGIAMSRLSDVEQDTRTKAVLAARVYYAAKAGLEFGIQQSVSTAPASPCGWAPATPALGTAFTGVTVTVTCAQTVHGANNLVYYIKSNAKTTGTVGTITYAERWMEATVSNIP